MFGKYFRNENLNYWTYCLLPLILTTELFLYAYSSYRGIEFEGELGYLGFLWLLCFLAILTSAVLIFLQINSLIAFKIRLRKLTKEQRTKIKESINAAQKNGKFFKNEDVMIYYGMFSKQVILMKDISEWYGGGGTYGSVRTSVTFEAFIIRLKTGKEKIFDASGKITKLPLNSILVTFLVGVSLLIFRIYPRIMDLIAGDDVVKRVLFHTAYDFNFWVGAIVINVIVWILAFYFKIKKWGANFNFVVVLLASVMFFLFGPIIFGGIGSEKNDGADIAKKDLKAYIKNEYQQTEAYCVDYKSFDYVNKTRGVNERVYRLNIDGSFVEMEDIHHNRYEFLYIFPEWEDRYPQIGEKYKIYYLSNTNIVIYIEKME